MTLLKNGESYDALLFTSEVDDLQDLELSPAESRDVGILRR
jgi:hypothetical protein